MTFRKPARRGIMPAMMLAASCWSVSSHAAPQLQDLHMPAGFHIATYATHVPGAREIALGEKGTVFLGSMGAGKVYALTGDGDATHPRQVRVIAHGLNLPVGVAFFHGDLYVSDTRRIVVLRGIEDRLDHPPAPETVADNLPYRAGDHSWKFIAFGPDGKLYVPIGSPCNVCEVGHDLGKLMRMNPDGTDREDIAYGIRNSVGFTWQPHTGTLWFTDNGRDMLGDDVPDDELNRLDKVGQSFGFPYCHQGNIADPTYGHLHPCSEFTPPVLGLGAHVAALGLRFYEGTMFPAPYRGSLLIAEHGSWNRSRLSGYRVVTVPFGADGTVGPATPLVDGFEQNQVPWGRPADVQPLPDGSVLISDDQAGAVYRLTYDAHSG
ncbi:PQQ-dependent sugar dehydrogenase [Novacetimonas pomaceti]|uniref:PQQ-dependent sugar dehydrogenase n=1 Tax=Novacetimonas pomaceti TaxID=2021998 RepID=UPI0038D0599D